MVESCVWRKLHAIELKINLMSNAMFDTWVGKIFWRRKWQPTPASLPKNSMDGGAWLAIVHGVAKSWTGLSDFTFNAMLQPQNCIILPHITGQNFKSFKYVTCRFWRQFHTDHFPGMIPLVEFFIANMYCFRDCQHVLPKQNYFLKTLQRVFSEDKDLAWMIPQSFVSQLEIWTCHSPLLAW